MTGGELSMVALQRSECSKATMLHSHPGPRAQHDGPGPLWCRTISFVDRAASPAPALNPAQPPDTSFSAYAAARYPSGTPSTSRVTPSELRVRSGRISW